MKAWILALGLALLGATPALGAPPEQAGFTLDGVDYEYLHGVLGSGNVTLDTGRGPLPVPQWRSCAFAQLHPGLDGAPNNGRLVVPGLFGSHVDAAIDLDQFHLGNDTGFAYDLPATVEGVDTVADVFTQGNATLRVRQGRYADPVSSTGIPILDVDLPDLQGSFVFTRTGVREDAGGDIAPVARVGDDELHLWVSSPPEAIPTTLRFPFDSGSTGMVTDLVMPGLPGQPLPIPPTEAYGAIHLFENLKFGGNGTVELSASAPTPPGMNDLLVRVLSPEGDVVGEGRLTPALASTSEATLTFPLDQLGVYAVMVTGTANLASYSGDVTLEPPARFDLHVWWENVTYGYDAYVGWKDGCLPSIGSRDKAFGVESVVERPPPPRFRLGLVLTGIGAVATVATIAVKLASDQLALSSFRKSK